MAKNKSQNRGAATGGGKRTNATGIPAGSWRRRLSGLGRFARLGRAGRVARPATRTTIKRSRLRRERTILALIAVAILAGVGSLGASLYFAKADRDWASVAMANGHSISREALRGRMAVLALLAQEREAFIAEEVSAGRLPSDQGATLEQASTADTTLEAARQSLIDDELLRELAARDGVATPTSPDPWSEATAYTSVDLAHRVRYIRFGLASPSATTGTSPNPTASPIPSPSTSPTMSPVASSIPSPAPAASTSATATPWPAASPDTLDATITRIRTEFTADTPVTTIVADLHDAGWQVYGGDVLLSADGVPSDPTVELDSSITAGAIAGSTGAIVGPTVDAYGQTNIGKLLGPPDATMAGRRFAGDANKTNLDASALQAWADGRALKRTVAASQLAHWRSTPLAQAHFRELVIGPAPGSTGTAGPWIELSALATNRLTGVTPSSITGAPAGLDLGADNLARTLRSMSATDRAALFRTLVAAANRPPAPDATSISGELGFFAKGNLATDLDTAAFADSTRTGDILGPISGPSGPTLYLVESRYAGTLDDRSQIALRQIGSDPAANPLSYTTQFSPADVPLAQDAGWRADAEFGSAEPVRAALFDTAIGILSDPFVLDGKLALAYVTERRTAAPDVRMLDRLALDGYDAWFGSEYAKATITRSDDPLPELRTPAPSGAPTVSLVLPTGVTLNTATTPEIPGAPGATPVPTDDIGLPALP